MAGLGLRISVLAASLVLTVTLTQGSPYTSEWRVGDKVVPCSDPITIYSNRKVVSGEYEFRVYDVQDVRDGWLWVRNGPIQGWILQSRVCSPERAIDLFTDKIRRDPGDAWSLYRRGLLWLERNEFEIAASDFSMVIRIDPGYSAAYIDRARALASRGKLAEGLADLDEAIRLDPRSAYAFKVRADLRDRKGLRVLSVGDLDEAIRLDSGYTAAILARAEARRALQQFEPAIADYTKALTIDPDGGSAAAAHNGRGLTLRTLGRFREAILDFDAVVRLIPKEVAGYNNRANAWEDLGENDKAIADLDIVLRMQPDGVWGYLNRGQVRRNKGDLDGALADDNEVIRRDPRNDSAYINRGIVRKVKHDYHLALADFEESVRIKPDGALNHAVLGWFLATCPDPKFRDGRRSLLEARRACNLSEWKEPGNLGALAAACAETANFEDAVLWQTRAIELIPTARTKDLSVFHDRLDQYKGKKPLREDLPVRTNLPKKP